MTAIQIIAAILFWPIIIVLFTALLFAVTWLGWKFEDYIDKVDRRGK